jgi:hypothetical protein
MTPEEFLGKTKSLTHVGPAGTWDRVRADGLRTARQLIDAADLDEDARAQLRTSARTAPVTVTVGGNDIVLHEQVLNPGLAARLGGELTLADWIELLNCRAYLYPDRAAMKKVTDKYVAATGACDLLTFSPMRLVERVGHRIELADQPTTALGRPSAGTITRTLDAFKPTRRFPIGRPIREVTVIDGIAADDIAHVVIMAERWHTDGSREQLAGPASALR